MAVKRKLHFVHRFLIFKIFTLLSVIGKPFPDSPQLVKSPVLITIFDYSNYTLPSSTVLDDVEYTESFNLKTDNYDISPKKLGPFFGYFNNLSFNDLQSESSCPVCDTCNNTGCPECPGTPGTAPNSNQIITSCNTNDIVVLSSAPSGTVNVAVPAGSVSQCYFGFLANLPYNTITINCSILSRGSLTIITSTAPSLPGGNGALLLGTSYTSLNNNLFLAYMADASSNANNDLSAIQFKCTWVNK